MKNEYVQVPEEVVEEPEPLGQSLSHGKVIDNLVNKWREEGYSDKEIRELIEILAAPD